MVTSEKYFETAGFSSDTLPSNFKPPEPNAFWSFRSKSRAAPRCTDGEKYEAAIPAVPLRSVPTDDMKWKPEKSVSSHDNDCDEGHKKAKTCFNTVNQKEELWKHETDKLATVIAEAKEFLRLLDAKYSMPNTFPAAEDVFKDTGESKSDVFTLHSSIDQSLSRKRLKVSGRISVAVGEENAVGTETMSEDEGEVSLLSPAEWKALHLDVNHKDEFFKPQGTNIVDYIDPVSVANKSGQPSGKFPSCGFTDFDECSAEGEQYDALKMPRDDDEASATYSMSFKNKNECCQSHKELINLEIVQHDHPQGRKVMEALKLFKEEYNKLLQDHESETREGKSSKGPHLVAAERVKAKGMNFSVDKPFGHIPGIEIGDEFSFRAELTVVGLNLQFTSGIDYCNLDGTPYATSVVDSGRYENMAKEDDILIYSGQGGNPNVSAGASDQKLERGNLALSNSMKMGFPVRVIHKRKCMMESKTLGINDKREYVYVYDGLYKVNRYWHEREQQNNKLVYKFELQRLLGQPRFRGTNVELGKQVLATENFEVVSGGTKIQAMKVCKSVQEKENFRVLRSHGTDVKGRKQVPATDICVLDDVSEGKEKFKVRAMNRVDDDHPPPFTYMTHVVYPSWYWHREPDGCDCINGCSDSVQCPCVKKNGGEIPYNEKGQLMKARTNRAVHECGPLCKCPPSCMNRVSQHGPCFQLEIFKTKSMGWGVRARNYIMPGSFICEYIGELLDENEADQKIGKDEYLFDICHAKSQQDDFALDAAKFGNIGRFINHSCDPNVFAQKVLYDHVDDRMPHIMFFASKRIPPGQELMYDYNYNYMKVRDANGNIKSKACHCGSSKCTGWLY